MFKLRRLSAIGMKILKREEKSAQCSPMAENRCTWNSALSNATQSPLGGHRLKEIWRMIRGCDHRCQEDVRCRISIENVGLFYGDRYVGCWQQRLAALLAEWKV